VGAKPASYRLDLPTIIEVSPHEPISTEHCEQKLINSHSAVRGNIQKEAGGYDIYLHYHHMGFTRSVGSDVHCIIESNIPGKGRGDGYFQEAVQ